MVVHLPNPQGTNPNHQLRHLIIVGGSIASGSPQLVGWIGGNWEFERVSRFCRRQMGNHHEPSNRQSKPPIRLLWFAVGVWGFDPLVVLVDG